MESLDRFNEMLSKLAQMLFDAAVLSEAEKVGWSEAFCEARFTTGGTRIWKFRANLADGRQIGFFAPDESRQLLERLWAHRNDGLIQDWFGLRMSVTPEGKCSTDFNFDPQCAADPIFFDD